MKLYSYIVIAGAFIALFSYHEIIVASYNKQVSSLQNEKEVAVAQEASCEIAKTQVTADRDRLVDTVNKQNLVINNLKNAAKELSEKASLVATTFILNSAQQEYIAIESNSVGPEAMNNWLEKIFSFAEGK